MYAAVKIIAIKDALMTSSINVNPDLRSELFLIPLEI